MTVITIVLIAIVLGVGIILVPRLMNKTSKSVCCTNAGYVWKDGKCYSNCTIDSSTGATSCSSETTPACDSAANNNNGN